jgi:hypothetical protein
MTEYTGATARDKKSSTSERIKTRTDVDVPRSMYPTHSRDKASSTRHASQIGETWANPSWCIVPRSAPYPRRA